MRVEKITVGYKRKFNLGDYQSLELSVMPTFYVDDGDDLNAILHDVWQMCRTNVEHAAQPIVAGRSGVTSQELFLGLPIELQEQIITKEEESRDAD